MKRYMHVAFLAIAFLVGAGFAAKDDYIEDRAAKRQSVEAPAQIQSVRHVKWTTRHRRYTSTHSGYNVSFTYVVDGQQLRGYSERDQSYTSGTQYKACYDPANPDSAHLRELNFKCGGTELFPSWILP